MMGNVFISKEITFLTMCLEMATSVKEGAHGSGLY